VPDRETHNQNAEGIAGQARNDGKNEARNDGNKQARDERKKPVMNKETELNQQNDIP